jgi:hypothetical protein
MKSSTDISPLRLTGLVANYADSALMAPSAKPKARTSLKIEIGLHDLDVFRVEYYRRKRSG